MAHALVVGGTLFIGRSLVDMLLQRGDAVTIMHRGAETPFGDRVQQIRCDRNDVEGVRAAVRGRSFDVVYDNVYDWQRGTSAEPVVALAEAVGGGLARYVFMSSVSVYGGGMDHDEAGELVPPDHPDDYMRHKANTERALFGMHRTQGLPVSTLRPAFVYGPHNPFEREAFFWDRILAGRPVIIPEDGSRTMQWVHADDVAEAAVRAAHADQAIGSAYNLGNDPPITQVEFVQMLARAAGREAKLAFVPRDRILAAGGHFLMPPLYFGVYLDIPPIGVRVERLRRELGVELRPLEEGLRDTFEWYRQQRRAEPDFSWEEQLVASVGLEGAR